MLRARDFCRCGRGRAGEQKHWRATSAEEARKSILDDFIFVNIAGDRELFNGFFRNFGGTKYEYLLPGKKGEPLLDCG